MQAPARTANDTTTEANGWVAAAQALPRELADLAGPADVADPADITHRAPVDARRFVVDLARVAADADLAVWVVPSADGRTLTVSVASGVDAERWEGRSGLVDGSLSGAALHTGAGVLHRDVVDGRDQNVHPIAGLAGALAVPLRDRANGTAVLVLGRAAGRTGFTATDLALATLFAGQVSLLLTHGEDLVRSARAVRIEERDRMARALQGHVIAPLFSLGMTLQGATAQTTGLAARHLETGSDRIDEAVKAIRAAIYRPEP